jgi:hypothetical protein
VFAGRMKTKSVTAVGTQNTVLWPKTMTPFGYIGLLPFFSAPSLKKWNLSATLGWQKRRKQPNKQSIKQIFIYLFIHNFSKIYVSFQILQIYTKPLYGMVFGSNLQPPYGTSNRCVIWQLGSVFSKNRNFFNELRWR